MPIIICNPHTYSATSAPRERNITNWSINYGLDHQGELALTLTGIVESGVNERPKDPDAIRFTQTSPIKSVQGHRVITRTGSLYHLRYQPSDRYHAILLDLGLTYNPNEPLEFHKIIKAIKEKRRP